MRPLVLSAVGLFAVTLALAGQEAPPAEKAKIEALIRHVEGLAGATFVRNGTTYDAASAATFLRRKWQGQAAAVPTAAAFIDRVATASGTSGRPYLVRLKDGTEHRSGEYLHGVLKTLHAKK